MEIKELLVQGSSKKVYATNQDDQIVIEFQDSPGGSVSKKKVPSGGKSALNNAVSAYIFGYLESYNVPTHFVKILDSQSFVARKLEMIPIVITVHNVASADLKERFGIDDGKVLEYPVVEMYLKRQKQKPMINEYHAYALGLSDRKEMTSINRIATKVNAVLKSFFDRRKLKLVSFNLEFGRVNHQILLADEISLDTMKLWMVDEEGNFERIAEEKKNLEFYEQLKSRITGEGS